MTNPAKRLVLAAFVLSAVSIAPPPVAAASYPEDWEADIISYVEQNLMHIRPVIKYISPPIRYEGQWRSCAVLQETGKNLFGTDVTAAYRYEFDLSEGGVLKGTRDVTGYCYLRNYGPASNLTGYTDMVGYSDEEILKDPNNPAYNTIYYKENPVGQSESKRKNITPDPSTSAGVPDPSMSEAKGKLQVLKSLLDEGLIDQSDYEKKKAEILNDAL